jgi:tetratricopeptide (TPR) repeat protein/transcriptional regulator with XRE-family HTH domain
VARGDRDRAKERAQLRERLQQQGRRHEQIAAAMTRQFGDKPCQAWRHAHGWTQNEVAERFNEAVGDERASMTGNRISDYERWPRKGGMKPTVRALAVLAKIYSTRALNLIDPHDRQKFDAGELLALSTVEFVAVPRQLPSAISNFVGRAHELKNLTAQLDSTATGSDNAVIITSIGGTAGIGKTSLAVHWARRHSDRFPDGQLYVDLRGFDPSGTPLTPETVIRGFLDSFHFPAEKIPIGFDAQAALYRTLVENKKLVIVLDNARDADQIWPLLPGSPTCMVLVTSRQQLGSLIARKQATQITLELFTNEEARQLLTNFLGTGRINTEPDAVDELIQRCVGLPIALSIAAARVLNNPHLPLSILVDQLREERQRLDALSTGGDSQLTDIRAVFSWSYTALSPNSARLFRLLGLHPGPDISTLAAASLVGLPETNTQQLLTKLTLAHLLKEHIPGRYQFHDLLRVYATEQTTQEETEPQQQTGLHRVLDYYLHTCFIANRHLHPHREPITLKPAQHGITVGQISDYQQAWEWFTTEHAVLLAAITRAATQGFDTHAWQLSWTLASFLSRGGHWHDWATTQQTALAAANRLGDRAAQAHIRHALGYAHIQLGHYTDALVHLQQALILYQDLNDRDGQARTHRSLSMVCERQGHYTQALTHDQQSLDLSRATGNQLWQARALNNLGWGHALLGNHQQTLTYCQQALNLHRELNDLHGEAHALDSLGYAYHQLSQHDQAITHYQQSIALFRELGDRYYEARALMKLGDTHHTTSNVNAARAAWQQALTILDQLGHSDADTVRAKLATLDTDPDTDTNDF